MKITHDNYKMIYGKLEKFFKHKSFLYWHTFDCGLKKHIPHYIIIPTISNDKINTMRKIDILGTRYSDVSSESFIVDMTYDEHMLLHPDKNEILFLGSRIVIKSPTYDDKNTYCYEVFQIN